MKHRFGNQILVQQDFNTFYPLASHIFHLTLLPFPISPNAEKKKQS